VISDRYVDSSLAYQGAGRTLPVPEISWLSSWATGGLKPDLVVLLDVDPDVGLARVDARGAGADRLESESRAFHDRVRYAFLDLAAADPKRYLVLDAARPAEEIGAVVAQRVSAMLHTGDDSHPADDSTRVPPGPDLDAPDLAAPSEPKATDTPLEVMQDLTGTRAPDPGPPTGPAATGDGPSSSGPSSSGPSSSGPSSSGPSSSGATAAEPVDGGRHLDPRR
jgi:dTMP kinase